MNNGTENNNQTLKRKRETNTDQDNSDLTESSDLRERDINEVRNQVEQSYHILCEIDQVIEKECVKCFDYYFPAHKIEYRKEFLPKIMHTICEKRKHELLKKLCEMKDSPEKAEIFNYVHKNKTPLQICVENGDIRAIDLLLRQSLVDIFKVPKGGISAFQAALECQLKITNSNNEDLSKFIDNDRESNENFENNYLETVQNDTNINPFRLLLFKLNSILKSITVSNDYLNSTTITYKYFLNLMKIYSQTMIKTIDNQNYQALQLMLSTGISYEKISQFPDFHLPIFAAVYKGDVNIIKMMIKHKTNFAIRKKFNQIPIHILSAKGFLTSLKLIIDSYYLNNNALSALTNSDSPIENNLDNNNNPPSALNNSSNMLSNSIDNPIVARSPIPVIATISQDSLLEDPKTPQDFIFLPTLDTKMTVLHFAALNNNPNTLRYLLDLEGAANHLNQRNKNGSTPLLCASSKGNIECLKILLERDDTNLLIGDLHGNTPIVYATYYNREDCAKELLKAISRKLFNLSKDNHILDNNNNNNNNNNNHNNNLEGMLNIESLLIEKRKWFILSSVDSNRDPNAIVNLESLHGNNMQVLQNNIQSIRENFAFAKALEPNNKIPTLEIKIDQFERGSGVLRQWLIDAAKLFTTSYILKPIFDYTGAEESITTETCEKEGYVCNINLKEYPLYLPYFHRVNDQQLHHMKNFGLFMAIAFLYNPIYLPLSPVFFKILLDEKITMDDILPKYMIKYLSSMLLYTAEEMDRVCMTMSVRSMNSAGEIEEFELVKGGRDIPLTKENLSEYRALLLDFYINKGERGALLRAFKEGFFRFLDPSKFKDFLTHSELIKLVLKTPEYVKVDNWKKYTKVVHSLSTEPIEISWFWEYASQITREKQCKLLEFACGSPILPIGNFQTLFEDNHPFTLQYAPSVTNSLPWAFTCTYTLHIPHYSSKEDLTSKFDYALENFKGFQFV